MEVASRGTSTLTSAIGKLSQILNNKANNSLFSLSLPGCVSTQRQDRLQGPEAAAVRALQATGVAEIARARPGDTARAEAPAEDHLRLLIMIILLAKQTNKLQILEVRSAQHVRVPNFARRIVFSFFFLFVFLEFRGIDAYD